MAKTHRSLGARWARGVRLVLAMTGVGAAGLGCGDEGGGSDLAGTLASEQTNEAAGAGDDGQGDINDGQGTSDLGDGSAPVALAYYDVRVTCDPDSMMTDLGWPQLPASPVVGAMYQATLSYVGDEPCIAARFDSVLLGPVPQTTPVPGPLPVAVSRGLDMDLGPGFPLEHREMLRAELLEPAKLLLENASVTWIEPSVLGWFPASDDPATDAQHTRLVSTMASMGEALFVLIVTRVYSAERVTNLDGGTDGLPVPAHSGYGAMTAAYECAALPLGDGGAFHLFDGVFFGYGPSGGPFARTDLPRRFCPELPGVDLPPGNGALSPAP